MTRHATFALASALAALAGCGETTVSHSGPVGITIDAKGDKVKGGTVSEDKSITTETGNPYAAFVAAARSVLGGREPSAIRVDSLSVRMGPKSAGVTTLEQVFAGPMDVWFTVNDSNATYHVARAAAPNGTGPLPLVVDFAWEQTAFVDRAKLIGGGFKVVASGPAAQSFTKSAVADLQLTFAFRAVE